MKLGEAILLYDYGVIDKPRIIYSDKGWILEFEAVRNTPLSLVIEAQRGGIRYYRGVRGALNACLRIGCKNVSVDLPEAQMMIT